MTVLWSQIGLDPYRDMHGETRRGCYRAIMNDDLYAIIMMRGHGSRGADYVIYNALHQSLIVDRDGSVLKVKPNPKLNAKTVLREKVAELINDGRLKSERELAAIKAGIDRDLHEARALEAKRKQQVIDRLDAEVKRVDSLNHDDMYRIMAAATELLLQHGTVTLMDLWPHVLAMQLEAK